jgi:hypothetical protein
MMHNFFRFFFFKKTMTEPDVGADHVDSNVYLTPELAFEDSVLNVGVLPAMADVHGNVLKRSRVQDLGDTAGVVLYPWEPSKRLAFADVVRGTGPAVLAVDNLGNVSSTRDPELGDIKAQALTVSDSLAVTGSSTLQNLNAQYLYVAGVSVTSPEGAQTLIGGEEITSPVAVFDRLTVEGPCLLRDIVAATVDVRDILAAAVVVRDIDVSSTLDVKGNTALTGTLAVGGMATLQQTTCNTLDISSSLDCKGPCTLHGSVTVDGVSTLNEVNAQALSSTSLSCTGDAYIYGNGQITGSVNCSQLTTTTANAVSALQAVTCTSLTDTGVLNVSGGSTLAAVNCTSLTNTGNLNVAGNIQTAGLYALNTVSGRTLQCDELYIRTRATEIYSLMPYRVCEKSTGVGSDVPGAGASVAYAFKPPFSLVGGGADVSVVNGLSNDVGGIFEILLNFTFVPTVANVSIALSTLLNPQSIAAVLIIGAIPAGTYYGEYVVRFQLSGDAQSLLFTTASLKMSDLALTTFKEYRSHQQATSLNPATVSPLSPTFTVTSNATPNNWSMTTGEYLYRRIA